MAKLNLETIAIVGGIGYLAVAYFMKLFPFDGTLDDVLGDIKGIAGGEPATGTDDAAIDPLTGTVGPAINPAAGAADKELSELELLAQTKAQYQSASPLVTGDVQGIGDTTIYNPVLPGGTPTPTVPAEEDETEACTEWCIGECNKLTGSAKTNCLAACASVCATGAGVTNIEDDEEVTIPLPRKPVIIEEEEEEEEYYKPNKSLCSKKFHGKCNTECKSPKSSACIECKQVCGSSSNYARSYFAKRAMPAYRDFITPVRALPSTSPMLRRGRARTGFRSYSTEAGFDSLRGPSTIKIRRFAMSS